MQHYPLKRQKKNIDYVKSKAIVGEMRFGNIAESVIQLQSAKNEPKTAIIEPIYRNNTDQRRNIKRTNNPR